MLKLGSVLFIIAVILSLILVRQADNTYNKSDEYCLKVSVCQSQYDSLQKEVKELEEKINILNKYLIIKHLEYIDVCDQKYKPK